MKERAICQKNAVCTTPHLFSVVVSSVHVQEGVAVLKAGQGLKEVGLAQPGLAAAVAVLAGQPVGGVAVVAEAVARAGEAAALDEGPGDASRLVLDRDVQRGLASVVSAS